MKMIKINIGCGSRHLAGWVNCDNQHFARPDRLFDFGKDEWPFPDGSADELCARHCLEHLEHGRHLHHTMKEAYRVLIPGARFEIDVPHPRSDFFDGDPTHGLKITHAALSLYSKEWCEESLARGLANTPLALQYKVDFRMVEFAYELHEDWQPRLLNPDMSIKDQKALQFAIATYNNVAAGIHFVLERV